MHNFTQYITEVRTKFESQQLTLSEIQNYIKVVNKELSDDIKNLLFLTQKYSLLSTEQLEVIRNTNKNNIGALAHTYSADPNDMRDMWNILSKLKDNELRALPQYQNALEREAILNKKLRVSDLTIDLVTDKGKREVIKMYMPLIYKIVNQYVGKSKLTRADLISAAMEGFNKAINDWDPTKANSTSFKTFASYCAKQQILSDINKFSHTLSGTNWYAAKKAESNDIKLDGQSLDSFLNDDGDWTNDHLAALGIEDKDKDDSKLWKKIYKAIEDKFKVRDIDIFYRYFGLNGRKKEKSKDIARSYGMSEGNIRNSVINKILAYLRSDKELMEIFGELQDIYNEGLMVELFHMDKQQILEALLNDDTFILLEEINRWAKKDVFNNAVKTSLENMKSEDVKTIDTLLKGTFDDLDANYKKNKKVIVAFLSNMYPTETFVRKSDVDIIDRMNELQDINKKFNK